jgi:hypothetical protein
MTRSPNTNDVLEKNVETLLESGGERPQLADTSRARIRAELVATHGTPARERARSPLVAVGFGLVATAAAVMIVGWFTRAGDPTTPALVADGTTRDGGATYVTEPGAKVIELGPRHLRVEGAALLDVTPGKGPFVVDTAHGRIEVLGTKFLVDGEHDRTTAAVVKGQVRLATSSGDVVLHAGEQAVAEPGRPPVRGPAPRLSHLVSWAQQARRRDEHGVEPLHHGTLFARDPGVRSHPPWGDEYPLPITKLGLDVVVEDQVARVALDQTFRNNETQDLEGVYRFAIPPDAALQRLAMYVDGKLTESAVVERMQARRIYEELVYRRVDPALLEWAGTGRLSLRVYPIPALQDKRLMLAYTQSLPKLYDDWTLTVPLPEVDQPVGELDVAVRVKGCANCELTSTSHRVDVVREGEDAIVKYRHTGEKIGDSFVVHVRDSRRQATVATSDHGGDRYLLVRSPADLAGGPRTYRPRSWVILDDVSASRSNLELRAQADLVDAFLRELDEDDKVSVVAFDVEARQKLRPTRVLDVDRHAVRKALDGEGGVGATDFGVALDQAMASFAGVDADDRMIVYLGDGVITSGERTLDTLRARIAGKAHFIGVGVGDGPDTQTLEGLAGATGGYATTIDLADDVGWRAFDLIAALHTARVTGLDARLVDASGALVASTAYLKSPQLADGEELELVAKLASAGTPAVVELTGTLDGAPWHRTIALATAPHAGAGYLPRMWAQRHIAARLLQKHEAVVVPPCTATPAAKAKPAVVCPTEGQLRETRDEAIRREVVGLGKQYFLLSRHTSLLVLENDDMYKRYGVDKGAGDTWAPYAMPSKIDVTHVAAKLAPVVPSDVADDAELVRTPIQVFYDSGAYADRWGAGEDFGGWAWQQRDLNGLRMGGIGHASGMGGGFGRMTITTAPTSATVMLDGQPAQTRADLHIAPGTYRVQLGLQQNPLADDRSSPVTTDAPAGNDEAELRSALENDPARAEELSERFDKRKKTMVTAGESGVLGSKGRNGVREAMFWGDGKTGKWSGAGPISAMHFTYPTDTAFDDITAFVPALVPGAADAWRAQLAAGANAAPGSIDDAARTLLADARRRLASGVYRWGNVEIAVDADHRIGWRRTTDVGLTETASYDGATWTRRYAELGLDVTRATSNDDVALALGYLPVWIAEPAHYAAWFDVTARGRDVVLSRKVRGKEVVALVLGFDDSARLVSVADGAGTKLVEIAWGSGPTSARVFGETVAVGFTGQAITDAPAWAHRGAAPGVAVELPAHLPAYWQAKIAKQTAGSPAWRHAERQLMVSVAATQDRNTLWQTYEQLRQHGGVEPGDLALAAGGIATSSTDEQLAAALAPLATQPIARYLVAGRAYGKSQKPERMKPETTDGVVGALWSLRAVTAQLAAGHGKAAADALVAMGDRAIELRLVAAAAFNNRWDVDVHDIARAWDAVSVGAYRNVGRAQAAQALSNRGMYDEGVDRLAKLVADLDLDALPPHLENLLYMFNSSRRGPAGEQIVWAQWRDRVLASGSYGHVMALLAAASSQHPADLTTILTRAAVLAGADADKKVALARVAIASNQPAWAESIIKPLLAASPTHDLFQLAANLALAQGKTAETLDDLEAAQDAGADEAVDLATVRSELAVLIQVAHQLAVQSTGAERARAIQRALRWGDRWRAIDPGNTAIDQTLGEMLLAVGDTAGAWRQLSSTIERDPWSGDGYMTVADAFERQGKVADGLKFWDLAVRIDQTNPTPRLRMAQALIALGRTAEGDAILHDITTRTWHEVWSNVVYQAQDLVARGKQLELQRQQLEQQMVRQRRGG